MTLWAQFFMHCAQNKGKREEITMKRRVLALLLVFMMVLSTLSACGKPAGTDTETGSDTGAEQGTDNGENVTKKLVIKLQYNRPDGDYTDWNVWGWEVGTDGQAYEFEDVDGKKIATIEVDEGATSFGYIVRKGNWAEKDIGEDQFIDIGAYTSGTLHVIVESGVAGQTVTEGDDIVAGTKITSAAYKDKAIALVISGDSSKVTKDNFVLQGSKGKIEIAEFKGASGKFTLVPAEELDPMGKYKVIFDGTTYDVNMPDYYSTKDFEDKYTYTGDDLGATWTKEATTFRLWAPTASAVKVNLYKSGTEGTKDRIEIIDMKSDVNGTWVVTKSGDLHGTYYTYSVTVDGITKEACDPYARTTGVNGNRAMVINLDSTDPEGWDSDKNPNADIAFNDAVIYELHIRDLGTDASSNIKNVGKFLSLTEHGTKTSGGVSTGVDHIKNLGITHLHILPMYDYATVDESKLDKAQFNWGYDPKNYNVPEGSYSTDPYNGEVRVKETKEMVQSLHKDGISVVMDVVYNHVYSAGDFCFNKIVPNYFSRVSNGVYSNGSGCGNDTASERAMVSKYIVDSVLYWAEEYHIDGFRFDLAGLIDTATINAVIKAVHEVRPDVVFYGEGWTMSTNVTKPGFSMTTQVNSKLVPQFAFFSDTIRDAIKGSVFDKGTGYVSGATGKVNSIANCFMGKAGSWCKTPAQAINYASAHDNNTLYDRLKLSCPDASEADIIKMNNLAAAIYMTSQGIPFIHAGEEMLRSKVNPNGTYNENSYNASDEVNKLQWSNLEKAEYAAVCDYYEGLIAFRKAHGALRLTTAADVSAHVTQMKDLDKNVAGFTITGGVNGETAKGIIVIFNPNKESTEITLPAGNWEVCINGEKAGTESLATVNGTVTVDAISAMVLIQK